jgi:hypothetical protein
VQAYFCEKLLNFFWNLLIDSLVMVMILNKDLNLNNKNRRIFPSLTYGRNVDAERLRELQVGSTKFIAADLQGVADVDK